MSFCSHIALLAGAAAALAAQGPAKAAALADDATAADSGSSAASISAVVVTAPTVGTTTVTPEQVFQTPETLRVIDQSQLQTLIPVGGAAQAFSLTPGAYVNGYGTTGATKYTIALDGIGQGWGGYGGYTGGASLMITMDGVPIVDPITGLWASASLPSFAIFQSMQATYGPGAASDRWYDNIGGSVDFTPLQPTVKPGGSVDLTFGSYSEQQLDFSLQTGEHAGWATVLAGSFGRGDSYRVGPDGFANPSSDYALYFKTVKTFAKGDFSFGGYYASSEGYRPQVIPTQANANITVNGLTPSGAVIPGQLYSQPTSGFYSTVPYANYEKFDVNKLLMLDSKFNLALDDTTAVHNLAYYVLEFRSHDRHNDAFPSDAANLMEHNNPHTWWFGDKVNLTKTWGMNLFDVGASVQDSLYNTRNAFFNPADGGSASAPNAKYRSGYFSQINTAIYAQDDIHPISNLLIRPSVRMVNFMTNYSDGSQSDFPNATGHDQGSIGSGLPARASRSFTRPEFALELSYQPQKWLNLYASYEEAYKTPQVGGGGGLYQSIPAQYADLALAQESQAGFKILFDNPAMGLGKFDAGASYFYLRYSKQTITTTDALGNAITAFGTSDNEGVNVFIDDNPLPALHTFINASYVHAIYSSYFTGSLTSPLSYNGSHVPYTPESTLNIGADYKLDVGPMSLDPFILFQYTGIQYIFDNTIGAPSNQTLAGYGVINIGVNATVPVTVFGEPRKIKLGLSVQNLANNQYNSYLYISSGGYYGTAMGGYDLAYPGAPRTVFGTIGMSF
jgi:iron complex outermembrane receptor protein